MDPMQEMKVPGAQLAGPDPAVEAKPQRQMVHRGVQAAHPARGEARQGAQRDQDDPATREGEL
jgi:hypothetical protein